VLWEGELIMEKIKLNRNDFIGIQKILEDSHGIEANLTQLSDIRIAFKSDPRIYKKVIKLLVESCYPYTLVVHYVELANKRQGVFTAILEKLKEIAKLRGFAMIRMQMVMSDEMVNFCIKNGFKISSRPPASIDGSRMNKYCNYTLEVK
jgi:hypothetical protein